MIRRSVLNISFANSGKRKTLTAVFEEARRVVNLYIDRLWGMKQFSGRFVDFKVDTWLSARMQQCLGKQALEIVKSQRKRKKKTKPTFRKNSLNLDSRFVQFLDVKNSFDFWIKLSSVGNRIALYLPAKRHKHFNSYLNGGWKLRNSIRLRKVGKKFFVDIFFEKDAEYKDSGEIVGIDIGYKKLAVVSTGEVIGAELESKIEKIARKKQGSKAFRRALTERNQYIDRQIKLIRLQGIKAIVVEDLKNVKKDSKKERRIATKFMNKLQRWVYSYCLSRLEGFCEVNGVRVHRTNPAYTSQTCSRCRHRDAKSRNGEIFCCTACGFTVDADWNASQNILSRFLEQEPIVPALS